MKETIPGPQTPPSEKGKKIGMEKTDVDKRDFLKAMFATGLATGVVAGSSAERIASAVGKNFEKQAESPAEPAAAELPESPIDPVSEHYAKFTEAVEAGDQKAIQSALEMMKHLTSELQTFTSAYAELQNRMIRSSSEGERALLENYMRFNRQRQDWLANEIKALREPLDRYFEKPGPEGSKPRKELGTRKPEIPA